MHSATGDFITALTTTLETYTSILMTALYNVFKFVFCQYDNNGNITGLNLLGSISVILLAFIIIAVFIRKIIEMFTYWHHEKEFIERGMEEEVIADPEYISPAEEYNIRHRYYLNKRAFEYSKKPKIIKPKITYIESPSERKFYAEELARLKAERRKRNKK